MEHYARIKFAVRKNVSHPEAGDNGWRKAWDISLKDSGSRSFAYIEDRTFGLTKVRRNSLNNLDQATRAF